MDRRRFLSTSILAGTFVIPVKMSASASPLKHFNYFGTGIYDIVSHLKCKSILKLPLGIRSYTEEIKSQLSKEHIKIDNLQLLDCGAHNYLIPFVKNSLFGFAQERGIILISESSTGKFSHYKINNEMISALNSYVETMAFGLNNFNYSLDKSLYTLPDKVLNSTIISGKLTELKYRNKLGTCLTLKEKKNSYIVIVSYE